MNQKLNFLLRPFEKIAGLKALSWGLLGLVVSTFLSYASGYHYHGLLQFGPAPNNALWVYAAEHLIVWLVFSVVYYSGGFTLSKSRIRPVDVLGTMAFAQLPLLGANLINMLPVMKQFLSIDPDAPISQLTQENGFMLRMLLSMVVVVFVVWSCICMFNALKVSCNLRKARLGWCFGIGLVAGEVICRILIGTLYKF